jgi:hypothetical protein
MSFLSEGLGFLRFAASLRPFLREPLTLAQARAHIQRQMARRDDLFLEMVERAIFANPRSPYLKLLASAGCGREDVRRLVQQEGLEGALGSLMQAGVYVTYEEFKGRGETRRGSQSYLFSDSDFDNPSLVTHFVASSGGTRGRATPVRINLDHIDQSAPHWAVWFAANDWLEAEYVSISPVFAGVAARQLRTARFGRRMVRWFSTSGSLRWQDRLLSAGLHGVIRWAAGFPRPEYTPLDRLEAVGEYLARRSEQGGQPCVDCTPSIAVRICLAMRRRGISLQGVSFLLASEPITAARKAAIEAAGARSVASYGFTEGGTVGGQCPHATAADAVHIFADAFSIVPRLRPMPDGTTKTALAFTALRPACAKIMLNTEIGDCGQLETRACECSLGQVGYRHHLHTIRSFEKVTGEGVTFLGADLYHLLESTLPARFGGGMLDYQLVEEHDANDLARYSLLISPEVGPLDEAAVIRFVLAELSRMGHAYRMMAGMWAGAGVLAVRRQRPLATGRGKVLPFRTLSHK